MRKQKLDAVAVDVPDGTLIDRPELEAGFLYNLAYLRRLFPA